MSNEHVTRNVVEYDATGKIRKVTPAPLDGSDTTMPLVIEALGGPGAYDALPTLDLGGREGPTGYIDFVRPSDLSSPVMKGTDTHGRPFISLLLEYTNRHGEVSTCVETIFRRYVTGSVWVSGGVGAGGDLLVRAHLTSDDVRYIGRVVRGEVGDVKVAKAT